MTEARLLQLEDELLGVAAAPSLVQRLSTLKMPLRSVPEVLRSVGPRGILESLRNRFTNTKSLYEEGRAFPPHGLTMVGRKRLRNIRFCIEQVVRSGVPGDLIEAGVWRGGAAIYMRAVLRMLGCNDRAVWLADSFKGIPPPDRRYPADARDILHCSSSLAVSKEEVEANFRRYDLMDDHVRFIPGWFDESLKAFRPSALAVLRIDCDLYGSTIAVLESLYDHVAHGGYVIVDDYGAIPGCRQAVEDFRRARRISDPIVDIDYTGIYWGKNQREAAC